jgi:hypothetical protein
MGELGWRCGTTKAALMRFSLCWLTLTLTLAALKLDDKTTKIL